MNLLTKALLAARIDQLRLADGREIEWKAEVMRRLVELQKPDGSWVNTEQRWWERDSALVTSYALQSLEMLQANLKKP